MTTFLQLHLLTAYPASNLNRDDTGSPKTLKFGGADRLRVSSQSLKRAIRTSDHFASAMGAAMGIETPTFFDAIGKSLSMRTRAIPEYIAQKVEELRGAPHPDKDDLLNQIKLALAKSSRGNDEDSDDDAEEDSTKRSKGKPKKAQGKLAIGSLETKAGKEFFTKEAVQLGPDEVTIIEKIANAIQHGKAIDPKDYTVLLEKPKAADIAMFGRMLADNPGYNVEAAVQVAHAFTTHRVTVEDDYYTAVDDLKNKDKEQDRGAGFIGIQEYGAGLFYLYICIDTNLLVKNLSGDKRLAKAATKAFIEAAATVSPKGKQNSYASRARASYALLEVGPEAPRTLAAAFMRPVTPEHADGDIGRKSIERLQMLRDQFGAAYGDMPKGASEMDVTKGEGTLADIVKLALEAIDAIPA